MSKGYFTFAQGEQYIRFAYALALSLKVSQKEHNKLSIGITPGYIVPEEYVHAFDQIIEIPWGDAAEHSTWKLENEWKAIHMSPYEETIKLDADMLFTSDLTEWWNVLGQSELVFTTDVVTFRNEKVTSDYYRKVFTENGLPNLYTGFFYFKKTKAVYEFFSLVEYIYFNWERYFYEFFKAEQRPKFVSTDVVFALAAYLLDIESLHATPTIEIPTFVHMKTELQGWEDGKYNRVPEDWNSVVQTYFSNDCELRISNHHQTMPFHYHVKDFITDEIISTLQRKLGL